MSSANISEEPRRSPAKTKRPSSLASTWHSTLVLLNIPCNMTQPGAVTTKAVAQQMVGLHIACFPADRQAEPETSFTNKS